MKNNNNNNNNKYISFIVIFATKNIFLILLPNINNLKKLIKICSYLTTCKQLFSNSTFDKRQQAKVLNSKALLPTSIPNRLLKPVWDYT
jgi:hypothetical protein